MEAVGIGELGSWGHMTRTLLPWAIPGVPQSGPRIPIAARRYVIFKSLLVSFLLLSHWLTQVTYRSLDSEWEGPTMGIWVQEVGRNLWSFLTNSTKTIPKRLLSSEGTSFSKSPGFEVETNDHK